MSTVGVNCANQRDSTRNCYYSASHSEESTHSIVGILHCIQHVIMLVRNYARAGELSRLYKKFLDELPLCSQPWWVVDLIAFRLFFLGIINSKYTQPNREYQ
jgi:hypothetical protein